MGPPNNRLAIADAANTPRCPAGFAPRRCGARSDTIGLEPRAGGYGTYDACRSATLATAKHRRAVARLRQFYTIWIRDE